MNIDADELFALIGRKEYALLQAAKGVAALRQRVVELEAERAEQAALKKDN